MATESQIDKKAVIDSFNRAASSYDESAFLQREIADRLIERLDYIKKEPKRILDLGSGTGYCTIKIKEKYPDAEIVALDIAEQMLGYARDKAASETSTITTKIKKWIASSTSKSDSKLHYICADAQQLPLQTSSCDLIISNLSLQWCESLSLVFSQIQRVLKADGFIFFTTFGVNTLNEIRQSWEKVNDGVHVNNFIDLHDVGDSLLQCGFRDPVMDAEEIIIEYSK